MKSQLYQGIMHVLIRAEEELLSAARSPSRDVKPGPLDPQYASGNLSRKALGFFGLSCNGSPQNPEGGAADAASEPSEKDAGGPCVELRCGAELGALSITAAFAYNASFLICDLSRQRVSVNFRENRLPRAASLGSLDVSVADMSMWGAGERVMQVVEAGKQNAESSSMGRLRLSSNWRPILSPAPPGLCRSVEASSSDTSPSRLWFLSVGVYSVLGLPRYGEGTLHWIVAECDHVVLEDSTASTKASHTVAELSTAEPLTSDECAEALRRKLTVLNKQGLNASSIARVYEVDDELLAAGREATAASQTQPGSVTQDLRWEHLFSFSTMSPHKAELNLKLMRRSPGKANTVTDRYSCKLCDLFRSDNHQLVQAASLKTGALLELRLELRPLGRPEGCLIAI